jgi:hypothetical protein
MENNRLPNNPVYLHDDGERNAMDQITYSFKNTNSDHSAIHLGYGMCMHMNHATLLGNAEKTYRIKGPSTLFAHIKSIQVSSEGSTIKCELIKDAVITNPGTEIVDAIQNLNHNSSRTPQTKVYDSSVTYTGGKVWCSVLVHGDTTGGGSNTSRSSGSFNQNENLEYITKNNDTDYILKITNLTSDTAINTHINMFFYEEPKGMV